MDKAGRIAQFSEKPKGVDLEAMVIVCKPLVFLLSILIGIAMNYVH